MKHFYFLLLIIILPLFSQAQYFRPGYVVDMKGDSIHGMISSVIGDKSPSSITILVNVNKFQYTVMDAQVFGVYIKFAFKRFVISASQEVPGATTADGADTTTKQGIHFLKVLAVGKNVSLYEY